MLYFYDKDIELNISRIGIGAARMGSRYSYDLSFTILDEYYSKGGNFIDTARNYYEWQSDGRGKSEILLGKWMDRRANRDRLCILTKGGTHGEGSRVIDLSRNGLINDIKESLDALGTDYIDIYALHRDDPSREVSEIMNTIQELVELGKVKKVCADCWDIKRIKDANEYAIKHNLTPFSVVETWWSLAEYTDEMWNDPSTNNMTEETMNYIHEKDAIVVGVTSQCKGFFQKAALEGIEMVDPLLLRRIGTPRNIRKMEFIREFCKEHDVSVTAFVNSYIYSSKCRGIGLVSCSSVDQMRDVMSNADYCLPDEVRRKVDSI